MSDKPVAERLQVKGERRLAVVDAPGGYDAAIGVADSRAPLGDADVVLVFVRDRLAFDASLPIVLSQTAPAAILWLAYPKLASAHAGDLSRDILRAAVLALGFDTVAQIAIDQHWSALRLKRSG